MVVQETDDELGANDIDGSGKKADDKDLRFQVILDRKQVTRTDTGQVNG